MFLTRTSCHKTMRANGYCGAWPGWAASISVLPLTLPLPGGPFILCNTPHLFRAPLVLPGVSFTTPHVCTMHTQMCVLSANISKPYVLPLAAPCSFQILLSIPVQHPSQSPPVKTILCPLMFTSLRTQVMTANCKHSHGVCHHTHHASEEICH